MKGYWEHKVKKGIEYYHEKGIFAFLLKSIRSMWNIVLEDWGLHYFLCRIQCQFRLLLDRRGLLKRKGALDGIPEVIISLTSYPPRIKTVHKAIESLLVQTYRADRIILWLARDEFPDLEADLPERLLHLQELGLEIRWCRNLYSYKKLIPAIEAFPDALLITVDDDMMCSKYLVERLIAGYQEHPDCIQCHSASMLEYHGIDKIIRFFAADGITFYPFPTYMHVVLGYAGCLYPPHCLHADVAKMEVFLQIKPSNDDLWFWSMGVLNGCRTNVVKGNRTKCAHIPGTQKIGLKYVLDDDTLFCQLRMILQRYPLIQEILLIEQKEIDSRR